MIRLLLACALAGALFSTSAAAREMPSREWHGAPAALAAIFRTTHVAPQSIALPAMQEKAAELRAPDDGRLRVGTVRALPKAAEILEWTPVRDGFVAVLDASSPEAQGIRVRFDVSNLAAPLEVRVQGSDGRIETMSVEAARAAWGPWTAGDTQRVELFSAVRPPLGAVRVGAVVHFFDSPFAKAAGSCTVSTACSADDAALDAAIAERKKSMMRINFVESGSSFACSATLINTDRFPAAYVLTADHCVSTAEAAASVSSLWFYEAASCTSVATTGPGHVQVAGGMQLVFSNFNVDSSLLLMNQLPPAGAVYAGWSSSRIPTGASVVSLSHPHGDTSRFALGSVSTLYRVEGHPQDMYGVRFERGIIQSGSSGSGLFTLANGSLQMRGILSGSTVRSGGPMSCTNLTEDGLYGRFDIFMPQIEPFIRAGVAADDAPNRFRDVAADIPGGPLNERGTAFALDARRIDYAGDLDLYRFTVSEPVAVSAWTEGPNLDTVGTFIDSRGRALEAEDDVRAGDNHFGITRVLQPGTYYVQVGHFEPTGTGSYNLRLRADAVTTNYTALWWNPAEPGWGINVNHQGNIVFATLFTYDPSGSPLWLVMSAGHRVGEGVYEGRLHTASGPPFNAMPWSAATLTDVGSMRLAFTSVNAGTLTYSYNGVQVSKSITRQQFGPLPDCRWSAFDRSYARNFQDLWWNPNEPGWGLNIAHQGDLLFATLFTYDASGRGQWYVMSRGERSGLDMFSGALYRMSGPPFNASPWPGATPTQVGTLTLSMATGNQGTLTYSINGVQVTKQIQRQVFGLVKPICDS